MRLFTSCILLLIFIYPSYSQSNEGEFGLEITKLNIGLASGYYSGRTANSNNGLSTSGQIYFPFRWAIDYEANFLDSLSDEYSNRIFLIRPVFVFQTYDDIAYGFGLANQFSWLITNSFYLEYQLGIVYNEATLAAEPDIYRGFSIHHYASISKPLSKHLTIHLGYGHLSNAGLIQGDNSIIDAYLIGLKFNTH